MAKRNPKQTSPKIAKAASAALRDGRSSARTKSLAGVSSFAGSVEEEVVRSNKPRTYCGAYWSVVISCA